MTSVLRSVSGQCSPAGIAVFRATRRDFATRCQPSFC